VCWLIEVEAPDATTSGRALVLRSTGGLEVVPQASDLCEQMALWRIVDFDLMCPELLLDVGTLFLEDAHAARQAVG
jgi:hypothetical protein